MISQLIAVEMVVSHSLKTKFGIGKTEPGKDAEDLERCVRSLLEEPEVSDQSRVRSSQQHHSQAVCQRSEGCFIGSIGGRHRTWGWH